MTQLHHKSPWVRGMALRMLAKLGDARAIVPAIEALNDPSPSVRYYAADALGSLHATKAIPVLCRHIDDLAVTNEEELETMPFDYNPLPRAAETALEALGTLKDHESFSALIVRLAPKYPVGIRTASIRALSQLGDTKAVPYLIPLLKDEYFGVCGETEEALGEFGDTRAIEPLIEKIHTESAPDEGAMVALGHFNDPRITATMISFLSNRSGQTGRIAAEILAAHHDLNAVEPLITASRIPSSSWRSIYAKALGQLGDRRAIPVLIEMIQYLTYNERAAAASALAQLGDPIAIAPLTDVLAENNDEATHAAIMEALAKLRAENKASPGSSTKSTK